MQQCQVSLIFFSCVLGESFFIRNEYQVKTHKEDLAVIQVLSSDMIVKAFIEVALKSSQELSCEVTNITETFLYGYYQLKELAVVTDMICILSDFKTWHLFNVSLDRDLKLKIKGYTRRVFDFSNPNYKEELLHFICELFQLLQLLDFDM